MNVVINRWNGEAFERPNLTCWACGKPATVVKIPDANEALLACICGSCLEAARQALSEAVLKGSTCGA